MRKLPRSQAVSFRHRTVQAQGGLCLLCGKPIDLTIEKEGAIDHNHDTGEIRGVLHRSCNAAEGKIANAAARWGCKSSDYADIIPYLERLVAYLKRPGLGLIYYSHKTDDEKRLDRNKRARELRAARQAARRMAIDQRKSNAAT